MHYDPTVMDRGIQAHILRLLLESAPRTLLSTALTLVIRKIVRGRSCLMERLGPWEKAQFVFAPTDVSRAFALRLAIPPGVPSLRVADKRDFLHADAVLTGKTGDLVDLLEGRADGDALFFSRAISIVGNVEATLALRNALDGEAVDLADELIKSLGPLSGVARHAVNKLGLTHQRISLEYAAFKRAFIAPVIDQLDRLNADYAVLRKATFEGSGGHGSAAPAPPEKDGEWARK